MPKSKGKLEKFDVKEFWNKLWKLLLQLPMERS